MFVGGIGSHLKVSQVDQSVCLGNELNNLSARKDFLLKNIKSSHPTANLPNISISATLTLKYEKPLGKLSNLDEKI